jgi:hypothetical protein
MFRGSARRLQRRSPGGGLGNVLNVSFLQAVGNRAGAVSSAAARGARWCFARASIDDLATAISDDCGPSTSPEFAADVGHMLGVNQRLIQSAQAWRMASPSSVMRLLDACALAHVPVERETHVALSPTLAAMAPLLTCFELGRIVTLHRDLHMQMTPRVLLAVVPALRDSIDTWLPVGGKDADTLGQGIEVLRCLTGQCEGAVALWAGSARLKDHLRAISRDCVFICARVASRYEGVVGADALQTDVSFVKATAPATGTLKQAASFDETPELRDVAAGLQRYLAEASETAHRRIVGAVNPTGFGKERCRKPKTTLTPSELRAVLRLVPVVAPPRRRVLLSAASHHVGSLVHFPHGHGGTAFLQASPVPLVSQHAAHLLLDCAAAEAAAASHTVARSDESVARVGGRTSALTYIGLEATVARHLRRDLKDGTLLPAETLLALLDVATPFRSELLPACPLHEAQWSARTCHLATAVQECLFERANDFSPSEAISVLAAILRQLELVDGLPVPQEATAVIQPEVMGALSTSRDRLTDRALAATFVALGSDADYPSASDTAFAAFLAREITVHDPSVAANASSVVRQCCVRLDVMSKDAAYDAGRLVTRTVTLPLFLAGKLPAAAQSTDPKQLHAFAVSVRAAMDGTAPVPPPPSGEATADAQPAARAGRSASPDGARV